MADEQNKGTQTPEFVTLSKEQYDELLAAQKTMSDKLEALEAAVNETPTADNALAISAPKKVELSGEKFKVGGKAYRAKFPAFYHNGRNITEAELLADSKLQKELVDGGYGVITEA